MNYVSLHGEMSNIKVNSLTKIQVGIDHNRR